MLNTELIPIRKQLERIQKKLDGSFKNQFLSINEVSKLTSPDNSTVIFLRLTHHIRGVFCLWYDE